MIDKVFTDTAMFKIEYFPRFPLLNSYGKM